MALALLSVGLDMFFFSACACALLFQPLIDQARVANGVWAAAGAATCFYRVAAPSSLFCISRSLHSHTGALIRAPHPPRQKPLHKRFLIPLRAEIHFGNSDVKIFLFNVSFRLFCLCALRASFTTRLREVHDQLYLADFKSATHEKN